MSATSGADTAQINDVLSQIKATAETPLTTSGAHPRHTASIRAKMQLVSIVEHAWGGKTLRFQTQYDQSIPEDRAFTKATPNGTIEMAVDNPAALAQFKNGGKYYVDFSPADDDKPIQG